MDTNIPRPLTRRPAGGAPGEAVIAALLVAMTLLCGSSAADARADDCAAIPAGAKIAEVGAFSNMRQDEEHVYGYGVKLWRAGDCMFGLFESSQGLAGDTPTGEIQDVTYDRKKGRLSFSAKLTTGLVSAAGSKGFEPARDLFTFDGQLRGTRLTGVITHTVQNSPLVKPMREEVVLRVSKDEAEFMHGSATYGAWRERWQPVLRLRGPKW